MRLKELRHGQKLLQKDIASILNIDRTTYAKYETNSSEPPLSSLITLCNFYSVTLDYLVGISDDKFGKSSSALNPEEKQLLESFNSLNRQGKEYITQQMAIATTIYKSASVSHVEGKIS